MPREETPGQCVMGSENRVMIHTLERGLFDVRGDIRDIKDSLLKRPTWAVTTIITFLCTLCVSLIVLLLK